MGCGAAHCTVGGKHFDVEIDEEGNKKKALTGLRLIAIAGANNAPDGATLTMAYEIVEKRVTMDDGSENDLGLVEWVSEMDIPADHVTAGRGGLGEEAEGGGKKHSPGDEAEAFIRRTLKAGRCSRLVFDEADKQGISNTTLSRSATRMAKNEELFM